jgi:type IV pilus assembly protein PilV
VAQIFSRRVQRGVSLIEVLMAVLIFSIGLIGLAGLMVMATRSSHSAYLRTQVTFLAQNMADRMRANPYGVWSGSYNNDNYPTAASNTCATGCAPADLANHDQGIWSSQLKTFLPAGAIAGIQCSTNGVSYTPTSTQLSMRPPYAGSCTMKITWSERSAGDMTARANDTTNNQLFTWKFQP